MPGQGAIERKRAKDAERKRKKMEEQGMDPDAKRVEVDTPLPPKLEEESPEEYKTSIKLAAALYEAVLDFTDIDKSSVSQLGSHFRVKEIKSEDLRLKNYRLIELLKRHPDVFDIIEPDIPPEERAKAPQSAFVVKIVDGGKDALKAVCSKVDVQLIDDIDDGLPPFEMPTDQETGLQAVRLAVARAMQKRGKPTAMQDLSLDKHLVKLRNCFKGDQVLAKVIVMFDKNFTIEDKGHGRKEVTLVSADVSDKSMLEELAKKDGPENPKFAGEDFKLNTPKTGPKESGTGKGPATSAAKNIEDEMWDTLHAQGFESFFYVASMKGWGKGKSRKN